MTKKQGDYDAGREARRIMRRDFRRPGLSKADKPAPKPNKGGADGDK